MKMKDEDITHPQNMNFKSFSYSFLQRNAIQALIQVRVWILHLRKFGKLDSGFCCTDMSDHNPHCWHIEMWPCLWQKWRPEVTLNFIFLLLKSPFWHALQLHSCKISFETADLFNCSKQMAPDFSPRFELQLEYSSIGLSISSSGRALLCWNRQQPRGRQWRAERQLDGFLTTQPLLKIAVQKGTDQACRQRNKACQGKKINRREVCKERNIQSKCRD